MILDARLLGKNSSGAVCSLSFKLIVKALKYPGAHHSTITDTKFNQFVPYWVASGAEDGVVKVKLPFCLFI